MLSSKDVRQFISSGFTAYQKITRDEVKLRLPILTYVAAQSAPTIDDQFVLLFFCLEGVVGSLDQRYPWEVIEDEELNTIKDSLRRQLRDMGKNHRTISVITAKIRELKRPPFQRRLSKHLKRLRVNLDDIGGYEALRHTIEIRDSLIHVSEVDVAQIMQEKKRLQTVVERVLLALLDWRGWTNTPSLTNRLGPAG